MNGFCAPFYKTEIEGYIPQPLCTPTFEGYPREHPPPLDDIRTPPWFVEIVLLKKADSDRKRMLM